MIMNDKIFFDGCYCINSAETKEIMAHYILQPHHIFIRVKAFVFMLVPGGLKFLVISTCFVWRTVTSISKCHVSTARAHMNCNINAWLSFQRLFILCDTGIYAIIIIQSIRMTILS